MSETRAPTGILFALDSKRYLIPFLPLGGEAELPVLGDVDPRQRTQPGGEHPDAKHLPHRPGEWETQEGRDGEREQDRDAKREDCRTHSEEPDVSTISEEGGGGCRCYSQGFDIMHVNLPSVLKCALLCMKNFPICSSGSALWITKNAHLNANIHTW